MTILSHPYSRYGLALLMQDQSITTVEEITHGMSLRFIQDGMNHFRLRPRGKTGTEGTLDYSFVTADFLKNNPRYIKSNCEEGFFLAPNLITTDRESKNAWNALSKLKHLLEKKSDFDRSEKATMSIMPMAAKFNNGRKSQSPPSVSFLEGCLCMITTSTPEKPALHTREKSRGRTSYVPTAIIPDLPLDELVRFIALFREMKRSNTQDLMRGYIRYEGTKKLFFHPQISNGNFPYAPRSSSLASAALLGAIGRFAREAEYPNTNAEKVLESLKNRPMYIVSYGKAQVVSYNHYVVDLAKNNQLSSIIDSLRRGKVTPYVPSDSKKVMDAKHDTFILFAARFLQLFDKQSFKEFLSVRAEYPAELLTLFTTYYRSAMKINNSIVQSATALGKWLNRVAYFAACAEFQVDTKDKNAVKGKYPDILKQKAKVLVELESAAFSAKSASQLVSSVITRAGRISGQDAPSEALPFIQAITAGAIGETEKENLENAKNMVTAFSRVRSRSEPVVAEFEKETEQEDENASSLPEDEKE